MVKPHDEKHILSEIKNLSMKIAKPDRWVVALSGTIILAPILPSIITTTVLATVLTNFLVRPFLEFDWKNKNSEEKQDQLLKKLTVNLAKIFLAFVPPLMVCTYIVSNTLQDIDKQKNRLIETLKNIPNSIKESIVGKQSTPLENLGNEVQKTAKQIGDSLLQALSNIHSNIRPGTSQNNSSGKKR